MDEEPRYRVKIDVSYSETFEQEYASEAQARESAETMIQDDLRNNDIPMEAFDVDVSVEEMPREE